MYDAQGRPGWDMEQSREKGLYAAAVAIAWGSQVNSLSQHPHCESRSFLACMLLSSLAAKLL